MIQTFLIFTCVFVVTVLSDAPFCSGTDLVINHSVCGTDDVSYTTMTSFHTAQCSDVTDGITGLHINSDGVCDEFVCSTARCPRGTMCRPKCGDSKIY